MLLKIAAVLAAAVVAAVIERLLEEMERPPGAHPDHEWREFMGAHTELRA